MLPRCRCKVLPRCSSGWAAEHHLLWGMECAMQVGFGWVWGGPEECTWEAAHGPVEHHGAPPEPPQCANVGCLVPLELQQGSWWCPCSHAAPPEATLRDLCAETAVVVGSPPARWGSESLDAETGSQLGSPTPHSSSPWGGAEVGRSKSHRQADLRRGQGGPKRPAGHNSQGEPWPSSGWPACGGFGVGGWGWVGKSKSCTNPGTRVEPQQIVAQRLLSCVQYPVLVKSSTEDLTQPTFCIAVKYCADPKAIGTPTPVEGTSSLPAWILS